MADDLPVGGAHRACGLNLFLANGANPGAGGECDGGKDGQVEQDDLGHFADAEPDDHQRQVGERRQRPIEFDRWIEQTAGDARDAHGDADRDAGEDGEHEGCKHATEAPQKMDAERVVVEIAGDSVAEGDKDRFGLGQK